MVCLLPNGPNNGAAAPSNWDEDTPSTRHVAVFAHKWTLVVNTKNSQEQAMPAVKYSCYPQADALQPLCPH